MKRFRKQDNEILSQVTHGYGNMTPTSAYQDDKTLANTVVSEVTPPNATALNILNNTAEDFRFRFGETQAEAETVTLAVGIRVLANTDKTYAVPEGTLWWAWINEDNVAGDVVITPLWG